MCSTAPAGSLSPPDEKRKEKKNHNKVLAGQTTRTAAPPAPGGSDSHTNTDQFVRPAAAPLPLVTPHLTSHYGFRPQ